MDCIFCKIIYGDISTKIIYHDADICAFYDINPQAPVHILLIPKQHISSLSVTDNSHCGILGSMLVTANQLAQNHGLCNGYNIRINVDAHGGQEVFHLHLHILGCSDIAEIQ